MVCINVILGSARIYEHDDRGSGMIEYILTDRIFFNILNNSHDKICIYIYNPGI